MGGKQPEKKRKTGLWQFLVEVYTVQAEDTLFVVAGGVAFYVMLAIFPAIAAFISVFGLVFDPSQVQEQFVLLKDIIPDSAYQILNQQITAIVSTPPGRLTFGIVAGFLFSVWSAARGMKALVIALNIAYNTRESRSIIKFNLLSLFLTFAGIIFMILSLVLIIVLPALFGYIDFLAQHRISLSIIRWILLALIIMFGLSLIYRYAPDRKTPMWQCVSLGAAVATIIWIIGSVLFSYYVANFGNYNEIYGSMGAVIILLLWFYLTAYLVLLGAEVNVLLEEKRPEDSNCIGPKSS